MQLSVIPHLTLYGDVKPEQIKKNMGQRMGMKFKELSGFRSATSKELLVPKEASLNQKQIMDLTNQLVKTTLKGETNRKALHEASG